MMRLIISDLHLAKHDKQKNKLFVQFCETQAARASELFILGDLFDFWLGDDLSIDDHKTVIEALARLSKTTKILVMVGNRDFLLGQDFEQKSGCTLITEPYLLNQNEQKYVLLHGDSLCTDDKNYQRLKKLLRPKLVRFLLLHLPAKLRLKLAGQLRNKSTKAQQYKSEKMMDVVQKSVDELMQKYPDAHLIHGHTHKQNTHSGAVYTRYVLGDWSAVSGNAIRLSNDGLDWLKVNNTID